MSEVEIWGARAGQSKNRLFQAILQSRRQGKRVLLIVPEQYTLQAERELIEELSLPGLLDLDVLSPSRLGRRIFEAAGHSLLLPLSETGRRMALAQALSTEQEALHYYRRVALSPGLPEKLSVLLADFQRAGVTPKELSEQAEKLSGGALQTKMRDLVTLWETYQSLTAERFQDATDQQLEMVDRLQASGLMQDAAVFVWQFDMLPLPLCQLLCEGAKVCARMVVVMTMDDKNAPDGHIFVSQRRSVKELTECLKKCGIRYQEKQMTNEPRDVDPALAHLEKQLFSGVTEVYPHKTDAISVHAAANPYAEAVYAAQTLKRWHDSGIAWQHMAVTAADLQRMSGILSVTLQRAGIPHYLARKDSPVRHGLCRMLLGALRCISGGYQLADVLQAAKSGFSPLTLSEADSLENYAVEYGIERKRWLLPFTKGEQAEEMEQLRVKLIAPIESLRSQLRSAKTAGESVTAVFRYLEEVNAYDRLMAREEELLAHHMPAEATKNRQVWTLLMALLDQLYTLLGTQKANQRDLARFIESGLTGVAISSLPPEPDTVMIGEPGHLMTGRIDAMLVMGMQDGVLGSTMDSLLTEAERRTLSAGMQRAIGMTQSETSSLRQSDFYRTFAVPRRFLTLTYAQGGQDGSALRQAQLVIDLLHMYPEVQETGGVLADAAVPLSPAMALDALPQQLRRSIDTNQPLEAPWDDVLRWLYRDPEWHDRCQAILDALGRQNLTAYLSQEQTRRLFTQDKVSISRLEGFAQCPYRHFVDYGLKPVIRKLYAFDPADVGDFYHAAMEGYAAAALQDASFPNFSDDKIRAVMDSVLSPLTASWTDGPLGDTPSLRLQGEKYRRTVQRAAWMFTHHAQHSRFHVVGEEVVFGEENGLPPVVLTLSDGRRVALRGKIDRIDRWEGDSGIYLLVSDYKSSRREIDPTRLWYGLQLQLMLYLQAACDGLEGQPAGAFYFTIQDPVVDTADVQEAAEKAIAQKLRLKGVVLADVDVVDALDSEAGYSFSKVFTKSNEIASAADAYTPEQMQALLKHARQMAARLTDRIRSGEISAAPAAIGDWDACQWCDYAAVCKLDPTLPGESRRELPVMDRQELLERMKE